MEILAVPLAKPRSFLDLLLQSLEIVERLVLMFKDRPVGLRQTHPVPVPFEKSCAEFGFETENLPVDSRRGDVQVIRRPRLIEPHSATAAK